MEGFVRYLTAGNTFVCYRFDDGDCVGAETFLDDACYMSCFEAILSVAETRDRNLGP